MLGMFFERRAKTDVAFGRQILCFAIYTNIRTSNIDSWDFREHEIEEMVLFVQTNQKIVVEKGTHGDQSGTAIPSVTAL